MRTTVRPSGCACVGATALALTALVVWAAPAGAATGGPISLTEHTAKCDDRDVASSRVQV